MSDLLDAIIAWNQTEWARGFAWGVCAATVVCTIADGYLFRQAMELCDRKNRLIETLLKQRHSDDDQQEPPHAD